MEEGGYKWRVKGKEDYTLSQLESMWK
jgi:HIV Tat-specific factor 1